MTSGASFVRKTTTKPLLLLAVLQLAYHNPNSEESWNPGLGREVLLGIVASELRLAVRALRDWCAALELNYVQPDCKVAKYTN